MHKESNIELENFNSQIREMLDAVSRTQYNRDHKRKEIKGEITRLHFKEMEELKEYLFEI